MTPLTDIYFHNFTAFFLLLFLAFYNEFIHMPVNTGLTYIIGNDKSNKGNRFEFDSLPEGLLGLSLCILHGGHDCGMP